MADGMNRNEFSVLNALELFGVEARKNGIVTLEKYLKNSNLSNIKNINEELESLIFEGVVKYDFTSSLSNKNYAQLLNLAFNKIQRSEVFTVETLIKEIKE